MSNANKFTDFAIVSEEKKTEIHSVTILYDDQEILFVLSKIKYASHHANFKPFNCVATYFCSTLA
jgi:hypothetical protein